MPWEETIFPKYFKSFYKEPLYGMNGKSTDYLLSLRKLYLKDRDIFEEYKKDLENELKQAKKEDKDEILKVIRFFREQSAECMKLYRACCFCISILVSDPPGDCKNVKADPILSVYIDLIFSYIDLQSTKG